MAVGGGGGPADLTWDHDANGTASDGTGTWLGENQWWDGAASATWNNATPDSAIIGSGGAGGTITLGAVTAGTVTLNNFTGTYTLSGGSLDQSGGVTIGATAGNVTISTPVGGNGALVKNSGATLTLSSTSNTFSGGITVNAGTLVASADTNLGATSGGLTFNGTCTFGNDGTWTIDAGRTITLSAGANVTFNSGGFTIRGPVVGSGTLTVAKPSQGNPNLAMTSTANTFTGAMNLNDKGAGGNALYYFNSLGDEEGAGIIRLGYGGQGASFIWFTGAIEPLVLSHRQFDIGGSPGSFIVNNNTADSNANTITINTDLLFTGAGSRTLGLDGTNTGDNTIAGIIPDGPTGTVISLAKSGVGTWLLSGANTYTGGTTVSNGILKANAADVLSTGNVTVTGGTLQIDAANAVADTAALRLPSASAKNITMNANDTVGALFLAGVQQPNGEYSAETNAGAWMNGSATLTVGPASAQPVYWDLDGSTAGAGSAAPSGTWNAANTYWNDADGTGTAAAWTAGRTAAFAAGSEAIDAYTVTVDGTQDIGGLTFEDGTVTLSGGTALRLVGDAVAYVNTGLTATVETPVTEDATPRSLIKSGTGTLVLSAANTYTGPTALAAGTLRLGHADAVATSSELTLAGGGVQFDTSVNLKALRFATNIATTISGGDLNLIFAPGGEVQHTVPTGTLTITSGITGSPNVRVASETANNRLNFYPDVASQTLGVITAPYSDGSGDKCDVRLGGTTAGNTVQSINYQGNGMHYGRLYKENTSTWTINGNVEQGNVYPNGGTLIINGTFTSLYQGLGPILSGARLGGNLTYYESDARFGYFQVNSGGIVAPGNPAVANGVGTITTSWGTNAANVATTTFKTGSIYEWQVGPANATDKVHVFRSTAGSNNNRTLIVETGMVLKILDAGGTPLGTDQLPVFTYDAGVVRTLDLGSVQFDTSALGPEWIIGTLALTDDGAGTIYLTGLSKGGGPADPYDTWAGPGNAFDSDKNGDGVSNGLAFLLGAASPDANALGLLPAPVPQPGGGLVLNFSCLPDASRGSAKLYIEHSADLGVTDPWAASAAVTDSPGTPVNGVTLEVTPGTPLNAVKATISSTEAVAGKLFGRLRAEKP